MFTGLVTDVGRVRSIERSKDSASDTRISINSSYDMSTVDIGASICCAGVCLTVVDKADGWFAADVSDETLSCTSLADWEVDALVNLERSLKLGDEMGGHVVSGHVDGLGKIVSVEHVGDGNRQMWIEAPESGLHWLAHKGSVAVDGVSLTVNEVKGSMFSIMLIPHTLEITTLGERKKGDAVNIEFDLIAKYVERMMEARITSNESQE